MKLEMMHRLIIAISIPIFLLFIVIITADPKKRMAKKNILAQEKARRKRGLQE